MNNIYTLLLSSFICVSAHCQDTIVTTDGDMIPATNIKIIEEFSEVEYVNTKMKEKVIDIEDVFTITDSLGETTYIYAQNQSIGNDFTIHEMSKYITGIRDAKKDFSTKGTAIGGFCIGLLSHFVLMHNVSVDDNGKVHASFYNFFAPVVSAAYCTTMTIAIPNKKINRLAKSQEEPYLIGYKTGVRQKRMKSSLAGSGIGLLLGYIVINTVFAN